MNKALVTWNILLTLMLAATLTLRSLSNHRGGAEEAVRVIRAARIELVDQRGKTKAVFEADGPGSSGPMLALYDGAGREAAFLTVSSKGYGTLYFRDKQTEGKVSVGYLWGSDTPSPADTEDPLSSWGIRVRGHNGSQVSFGVLNNGEPILEHK
jgi:hypothetical protein